MKNRMGQGGRGVAEQRKFVKHDKSYLLTVPKPKTDNINNFFRDIFNNEITCNKSEQLTHYHYLFIINVIFRPH